MLGWGCRCPLGALGRQASGSAPHRPVARATASPGQGGQARLAHGLERLQGIMGPLCSWPARLYQALPGPSGWWDWPLAPARSPTVLQMTLIFLSKEYTYVLCLCTRAGAHSTPFLSRGSWDATGHRCGVERLVLVPAGRALCSPTSRGRTGCPHTLHMRCNVHAPFQNWYPPCALEGTTFFHLHSFWQCMGHTGPKLVLC